MIHDGTAIFEADDIIVFEVTGATADGVLNDGSLIVRIIVYDNAVDYYNNVPKYIYDAPPGDEAEIDEGRNNMGDRYLEFDAETLVSSDPGAPVLGEIALVAGVDIFTLLATTNGPYEVPTNEHIDVNGDGVISPDEEGDAAFSSDLNILTVLCFAKNTLIETPNGPRAVETLAEGDDVNTLDTEMPRGAGAAIERLNDRPGSAFLAEQHVCFYLAHTGKHHDAAAQDAFEISYVPGNNPQTVIIEPKDMLHGLHLGDRADRAFEVLKADTSLGGQFDTQKYRDAKAQLLAVQVQTLPGDHAAVL